MHGGIRDAVANSRVFWIIPTKHTVIHVNFTLSQLTTHPVCFGQTTREVEYIP